MFLLSKSIFTFQNLALVLQKFPSMHNRVLIISDHTAISLSMAFHYRDPDKAYKKKKNWNTIGCILTFLAALLHSVVTYGLEKGATKCSGRHKHPTFP